MPEARNADVQISVETVMPEPPQRGGVLERGLLIGGKSVRASSGKVADEVSPWDGEIYARVAAGLRNHQDLAMPAHRAVPDAWRLRDKGWLGYTR
jgi:hypothetical protein